MFSIFRDIFYDLTRGKVSETIVWHAPEDTFLARDIQRALIEQGFDCSLQGGGVLTIENKDGTQEKHDPEPRKIILIERRLGGLISGPHCNTITFRFGEKQ